MDIRKIVQAAITFAPQKYKARLENGLAQAEQMLAGKQINNFSQAADVMRQMGVDSSNIVRMQSYLNNGLVNTVLSAIGVDKNGIAADLEKLKLTYDKSNNGNIDTSNSDLDIYKKNLSFLNKK